MERISLECDCPCHADGVARTKCTECFCAPCVGCGKPIRLLFLLEHQKQCLEAAAQRARIERVARLHAAL